MTRYGSGFREPPWVMGSPKEVMDWMEATHPKKKDGESDEKDEIKYLTNLHVSFDFDVRQSIKKSTNPLFQKLKLFEKIEEDIDLFSTAELILRGLAKAKFRNTTKIVIDKKTVYEHPENKKDLRKTIALLKDYKKEISKGSYIELDALLEDVKKCLATIHIKKIHKKKDHTIEIQFKGTIRTDIYHTFINYIKEHMQLTDEKQQ